MHTTLLFLVLIVAGIIATNGIVTAAPIPVGSNAVWSRLLNTNIYNESRSMPAATFRDLPPVDRHPTSIVAIDFSLPPYATLCHNITIDLGLLRSWSTGAGQARFPLETRFWLWRGVNGTQLGTAFNSTNSTMALVYTLAVDAPEPGTLWNETSTVYNAARHYETGTRRFRWPSSYTLNSSVATTYWLGWTTAIERRRTSADGSANEVRVLTTNTSAHNASYRLVDPHGTYYGQVRPLFANWTQGPSAEPYLMPYLSPVYSASLTGELAVDIWAQCHTPSATTAPAPFGNTLTTRAYYQSTSPPLPVPIPPSVPTRAPALVAPTGGGKITPPTPSLTVSLSPTPTQPSAGLVSASGVEIVPSLSDLSSPWNETASPSSPASGLESGTDVIEPKDHSILYICLGIGVAVVILILLIVVLYQLMERDKSRILNLSGDDVTRMVHLGNQIGGSDLHVPLTVYEDSAEDDDADGVAGDDSRSESGRGPAVHVPPPGATPVGYEDEAMHREVSLDDDDSREAKTLDAPSIRNR